MTIHPNYVGGEWLEGVAAVASVNPSDVSDVVGRYAVADARQANAAVDAAAEAFATWSKTTPQARFDVLDKAGDLVLARRQDLGRLLAREEGKTLADGIGEVTRAGAIFKFFAGEALRIEGDAVASVRPGVDVEVTREPIGVVGLITPWNFPVAIPAWKMAPALAYGNTVVLKPAELTPGIAWALVKILEEAGCPKGVVNLVVGPGRVVGEAMVAHPKVAAISFTGSVQTGSGIAAKAVAARKKVQLEMGGKNPFVVLDDADLKTAVECAVNGAFFQTGQRCTASSRIVVQDGIYPKFRDAVIERMKGLVVDHALKPGTDFGPAVDQRQLDQNQTYVKIGAQQAGQPVGGELLERETKGFYMAPCLFPETTNDMTINREEVFGPVAAIIRVKTYEEALAVANDTEFGLSAGICTTSLKHARDFRRNAQAGMVMVNLPTAGVDYHVPFGGRKGSSYGAREQGRYAAEFYTTVKTSYVLA
jgi:aldehyde dehydrogenase (NAD+)